MGRKDRAPQPAQSKAQSLFAPWRLSYMDLMAAKERDDKGGGTDASERVSGTGGASFLREYWLNPRDDEKNHVIVRTGTEQTGRGGLIMLNRYPYAGGHLLVCLGDGRPRLLDYDEAQRAELWSLTDLAVDLVERTLSPQGINVGVNQGMAAGAGVPGHVHVHIVPRWAGDVNFMAVCAHVRVIPSALEEMARRYREVWERVRKG